MKKTIVLLLVFLAPFLVKAQNSSKPADSVAAHSGSKWARISLDFSAGTRGAGAGMRYRLGDGKWAVRLGYSYMPITYGFNLALSGYQTHIDLFNNFQGIQPLLEFRPASNSRFKLIAGFSYFYLAKFNINLTPVLGSAAYKFGDLNFTPQQIGTVTASIDWSGIAPFIGFGFGSPHPKHKVGCSAGFGMYYLPQPSINIHGTNFLSGNDANQQWLSNNISSYRYLPILNFHINYRFKK